jgi:hypothetical protein
MKTNPLFRIQKFDQSVWLDFIRRGILASGELKGMIETDAGGKRWMPPRGFSILTRSLP